MTIGEALRDAAARLAAAGVENPGLDARLLLAHAMGVDQAGLLRDRRALADVAALAPLLARRVAREPVALIVGRQGFWTLDLEVSAATLIPRADSETLIEAMVAARTDVGCVLDLGTGTGCLLLAALTVFPAAWGVGVDRVAGAAQLARRNAVANGLGARASVVCADWGDAIEGRFDVVLSNPPYIPSQEIGSLMPDVAGYEPRGALDGGADGLSSYRAVIAVLPRLLAPGGLAVLELGIGQAAVVSQLARAAGFDAATRRDLGGVERAIVLETGAH